MKNENCETLQIKKSKIDLKKLNFVSLIDFKECLPPGGIANIGIRPTFNGTHNKPKCKTITDLHSINKH